MKKSVRSEGLEDKMDGATNSRCRVFLAPGRMRARLFMYFVPRQLFMKACRCRGGHGASKISKF